MRRAAALLLALGLAPGTWLRVEVPRQETALDLRFTPVALPAATQLVPHLGPFRLEGIWRLQSPHPKVNGYSGLAMLEGGRLLAVSDRGTLLEFSPPGAAVRWQRILPVPRDMTDKKYFPDLEAVTRDPATGRLWIAWESRNAIVRHGPDYDKQAGTTPGLMRGWASNAGAEAMVRLADGRFIVLQEGFAGLLESRVHRGVVFTGDPAAGAKAQPLRFAGPRGFSPTDMAQLPDGRVLILMRRLVWPMPARFAGRIVIADPAAIRAGTPWLGHTVAMLTSSLPVDNFEGIAVQPRQDGTLTVWLIADDNSAVTQSRLLWKLALDPADLPRARKKARGVTARSL